MIERIVDLPGNVLGFTARGRVTGSDYESTIIPAVEEAFEHARKMRFLYHLGPEFTGFDVAALWDDAKLGLSHFRGWERIAVVSDKGWIRAAAKAFAFAIPAEVRVFEESELEKARTWVSVPPNAK